jgi:ATP-dependent helicase/nuclease subunit B
LKQGLRVWATPDILPAEGWLTRELERSAGDIPRLLSPAEEWFLWRQCAADATGDLELVNRGALAEALRRSSALAAEYGIDIRRPRSLIGFESDSLQSPGTEAELLADVQHAVDEACKALGAATVASLVPQLQTTTAAAGFLSLPPRLRPLAKSISTAQAPVTPTVVIASDESEELERIAAWCEQQVRSNPDTRILITLPGAPGTRERLATLIQQSIDPRRSIVRAKGDSPNTLVVIEGGIPLAQVPAVAHALSTLSWLNGTAGDFEEVSNWLRAPYWTAPSAVARARLDVWLRERERMQFNLRDFITALHGVPSRLTATAREITTLINKATVALGQGAASPRDWSERFRAALDVFGWPGERTRGSGEQQTVVRFHELLDEFGQLAAAARSISRANAVQWFIELAARTAFRPADDDAVVTISSALAAPVVRYDAIWIAGLHAEAFPQPVQADPFIPLNAQIKAGVPGASADGRLAEARELLASWRTCADELVLSAPSRAEDLELLPSPLLAEWLPQTDGTQGAGQPIATGLWLPLRIRREGMLETLEDTVGVPWSVEKPLPSGTRSLELQNQCPFRAYAEMRLGSTPLDAPEPGIAADQRGQLLHAALQKLWSRLRDSRGLATLSDPALTAAIHRAVEEAANESNRGEAPKKGNDAQADLFGNPQYSPALTRECRRAERLIYTLCLLERQRADFSVQSTELDTTVTLKGAQLRMRIDRVDVLETGGRAILDYKSGRRSTADWYGERPSHPQLLAYLAALGDDVVAMGTVNVTAREVRFDGIANVPDLLPKLKGVEPDNSWPQRREEWLARMEGLAVAFLQGQAVVDPKPGACDYCHVASICRIADRIVIPETEDEYER